LDLIFETRLWNPYLAEARIACRQAPAAGYSKCLSTQKGVRRSVSLPVLIFETRFSKLVTDLSS
ncbi:MAG: hypothetical protein ACPH3N_15945, partial [Alcanivorax sediminis]|uniref:hypothetical protein n=1 Tax=Alcanivorax sediminis TaxID=2663008 RepID=UPI003C61C2B3